MFAWQLRQVTPPGHSPGHSARSLRLVTPPGHSARSLRQATPPQTAMPHLGGCTSNLSYALKNINTQLRSGKTRGPHPRDLTPDDITDLERALLKARPSACERCSGRGGVLSRAGSTKCRVWGHTDVSPDFARCGHWAVCGDTRMSAQILPDVATGPCVGIHGFLVPGAHLEAPGATKCPVWGHTDVSPDVARCGHWAVCGDTRISGPRRSFGGSCPPGGSFAQEWAERPPHNNTHSSWLPPGGLLARVAQDENATPNLMSFGVAK